MRGFLSISCRLLVNVESLNGVESIGNLSRHRTVPIVVSEESGYTIRYVPAISGESIAHAFQVLLVESAKTKKLPVGKYSERGEFLKFTDDKIMKEEGILPPKSIDDLRRTEIETILKDIVCDVGGFLYAGDYPIKRTSRFQVGYMIPALEDVRASALEAQFHVRHAPSEVRKGTSGQTRYQIPYNVEVGSAVYTFSFNLDINGIARPSTSYGTKIELEKNLEEQRKDRILATLMALTNLFSSMSYGAKRSRFLPTMDPRSAVACFSPTGIFTVSPGNFRSFISETMTRREAYLKTMEQLGTPQHVDVFAFTKEGEIKENGLTKVSSLEELAHIVVEKIISSGN
ncbi:MAG: type I-A CRISPR-associated protein Cas7/Csa2 [Candidatus Methanomethyliaceae archaeon]